ncbi:MerR family transcriptional regulator [Peptoniphilus equinus]|uniref:MerR family transcriptional regulator n=1 Tax=Peptoniphilus equinus TaxID=3016343 RepID=A0ABY7QTW6_9FIRM|nr:MerR family transcriptional regulator [Peptoniphilus equinus]WBW50223.1 MerR family transcriptional regulator [Peptoniphilus equinus]
MLRHEIQNKTGLTRKAIEYYEQKGLLQPQKSANGYRNYSEKDVAILTKVALLRKVGLSVTEIEAYLSSAKNSLSSILRTQQHHLAMEEKRHTILKLIVQGERKASIDDKLRQIEAEESIYERLTQSFPGYFGQMLFAAYQPFLNAPLDTAGNEAYEQLVTYLDNLPSFELTQEEQNYLDAVSSTFDMPTLQQLNKDKVQAVETIDDWLKANRSSLSQYEAYKHSNAYQHSTMKHIQDKLHKFMKDNNYYAIVIPLLRQLSPSYNDFYEKLLQANEVYQSTRPD